MRLSTRFALCVAGLVALLVLLAGLMVLKLASNDIRDERDRWLSSRLATLAPVASNYAQRPLLRPWTEERLTGAATGDDGSGGVYVQAVDGTHLAIGDVPKALPEPLEGPGTFVYDGARWRFITTELGARGQAGRLWVFEPEERLVARFVPLRRRVLLVTIIAAVVASAAGFWLGRWRCSGGRRARSTSRRRRAGG